AKTGISQDKPSAEAPQVADSALGQDNPAGLAVSFIQGTSLRIGQKVHVRVTTRQSGYLVLLDISPGGGVTQIFPSALSLRSPLGSQPRSNLVEPGRPLLVPTPSNNSYEGFEFEINAPAGV